MSAELVLLYGAPGYRHYVLRLLRLGYDRPTAHAMAREREIRQGEMNGRT